MYHLFVWGNVGGGPACRSDIDDLRAAHLLLPLGVTVAPGHWGHASTFTSVDKTAANLFLFLLRMRCIITGDEVPRTVRSRFLLHLFGGLQEEPCLLACLCPCTCSSYMCWWGGTLQLSVTLVQQQVKNEAILRNPNLSGLFWMCCLRLPDVCRQPKLHQPKPLMKRLIFNFLI